jgi:hypothetical protein
VKWKIMMQRPWIPATNKQLCTQSSTLPPNTAGEVEEDDAEALEKLEAEREAAAAKTAELAAALSSTSPTPSEESTFATIDTKVTLKRRKKSLAPSESQVAKAEAVVDAAYVRYLFSIEMACFREDAFALYASLCLETS